MQKPSHGAESGHKMHHGRLLLMAVLSFVSMYVLMYAMVDRFANVYMNLNQVYMAGLMAAPMVIIELTLMGAMYPDRKRNAVSMAASLVALGMFGYSSGSRLQLRTGSSCDP